MNQRRFLLFALGVGLYVRAVLLRAQKPSANLRRIGVLAPSTRENEEATLKPFFDQMRELGWIEGQTIAYDRVYADDQQREVAASGAHHTHGRRRAAQRRLPARPQRKPMPDATDSIRGASPQTTKTA